MAKKTAKKTKKRAKTNTGQAKIIAMLQKAYNMEIETVVNYLANSIYLDGIRAKHIKDSLATEVTEELGHAQQLGNRLKVLEGDIPGSLKLKWEQKMLQPPKKTTDVLSVIRGVIDAEQQAVEHYQALIEACEGVDPVTQDLCIQLKGDEEEHRRLYRGFLAEAQSM